MKASIPEASVPRASIREASISERSISEGVIPESSISEGSIPRAGEALPPAALDGVTDGVRALARPAPLPGCEPRRVSFDLAAPSAARPLPLSNVTNLTNTNPTNPTNPTINLGKLTNPTNRANPTNPTSLTNLSPPSRTLPSHAHVGGPAAGGATAASNLTNLLSPCGHTAGTPSPRQLPWPRQLQLGRRPMFATPPPSHAPPFVIYQGEGGEGGGGESGGRDASPHTAEQPVATAADGAITAMTPPLQFGYARRAMALALGPGKLDGVVAAAAM